MDLYMCVFFLFQNITTVVNQALHVFQWIFPCFSAMKTPRGPGKTWDLALSQVFAVDALDQLGRTPLMHATFAKSAEAMVWLVHRKAALETLGGTMGGGGG